MLNKKLGVSKSYLSSTIDRFESSFLQLAFQLWTKCDKNSKERPSLIVQSTYDALINKRWIVVTEIAEFVESDKAASEVDILMARINSLLARKNFEDKTKFYEEVNSFDVSAKNNLFKLAKHCLLDETELAISLAKRLEKEQMLTLKCLIEWPLFEDLRTTPKMARWLEQLKSKDAKRKSNKASKESDKSKTKEDGIATIGIPKARKTTRKKE
jgi:hypothetical protein